MNMNASLFSALKLEKLALTLILLLIVIVAAFNIVSTLVMVVTDKTREIGVLKSMGMTSKRILRLFMVQGLVIGIVGAADRRSRWAALVTYVVDRFKLISIPGEIYFISHLPVKVGPAGHRGDHRGDGADLVPRNGVSGVAGRAHGPGGGDPP